MVENARAGLAITDAAGGLLYSNKAMAEIHGFPPAAYTGDAFASIAPPDQLRLLKAACALVLTPGDFDQEIRCEHRDGTHFTTRLQRAFLKNPRGDLIGVICILQDPAADRPPWKRGKPAAGGLRPRGGR
jgi:PAS domain S-box-containing protein